MPVDLNGGEYGLSQTDVNKTILLLKLTDSALKCLEKYQDNPADKSCKPSIEFKGNQGVINIPGSTDSDRPNQVFTFQLASLNQSSGFDCLQQNPNKSVDCVGSIDRKITVNATDDSYNETRIRMTKAKEEEQKNSTKVIKGPNSKLSKRFPKRQPHRSLVEKRHGSMANTNSPEARVPTPPISRLTPTVGLNRSLSPLTLSQDSKAGVTFRNKTKPAMLISNNTSSSTLNTSVERNIRKPEAPPSNNQRKRPPSPTVVDTEYTNPVTKKQRVSHFSQKKPSPVEPKEDAISDFSADMKPIASSRNISPTKLKPGISFGVTKLPSEGDKLPSKELYKRDRSPIKKDNTSSSDYKQDARTKITQQNESLANEKEDYLSKYTTINNLEQRNKYKEDFSAEFEEYMLHHEKVQQVSERFDKWRVEISKCKKGTEKYEQIAKQIYKEYKKIKENAVYKHNRSRLHYLHRKLDHIKKLVVVYDQAHETSKT